MEEILGKQNKETKCYIMSAVLFFKGFNQIDDMTEVYGKMLLGVLGLSKEDVERFPMPDYSQIVSHLKPISDSEVRRWIIRNTYSPVLKSRKTEALQAFSTFCSDLNWDANEIKETTELVEELENLKPISSSVNSTRLGMDTSTGLNTSSKSGSGCLSVIALIIVSTALFAFSLL